MSDVCLILEGTYPYVTGGVSSCVYQLIKATPHLSYSIFYLGATEAELGPPRYPIPENVRLIKKVFLFDYYLEGKLKSLGRAFDPSAVLRFHSEIRSGKTKGFKEFYARLFDPDQRELDPMDILQSEEAWMILEKMYEERFNPLTAPSFIDYFYTWRFIHYPIFKVLMSDLPKADLYHAMCTGYAGLAGVVAKMKNDRPFILTEHGIYSHERRIEILQSQWLLNTDTDIRARKNLPVFKDWWIKMFEFLGLLAYREADVVTTLYGGNKEKQIGYGADPEKIRIIANGVNYAHFSSPEKNQDPRVLRVALIGRVVPIKDIKTFIKSIASVAGKIMNLKVEVIGPTEEDEGYFEDCLQLVRLLGLESVIEFTGKKNVAEVYPKIDLLVLSSISEGQPLVLLEAFCQGVPVVATDVGSCSELINGATREDRELGAAGLVVPFGRPDLLGEAIYKILSDNELREKMGQVAHQRVKAYYQESASTAKYVGLYNEVFSERFWYGGNRV